MSVHLDSQAINALNYKPCLGCVSVFAQAVNIASFQIKLEPLSVS